jgi:hypothetical protein
MQISHSSPGTESQQTFAGRAHACASAVHRSLAHGNCKFFYFLFKSHPQEDAEGAVLTKTLQAINLLSSVPLGIAFWFEPLIILTHAELFAGLPSHQLTVRTQIT